MSAPANEYAEEDRPAMPIYDLVIDPIHSTVEFAVTFAMNSVVKGRFLDFGGEITLDADRPDTSSLSAWIQAASVTTDHEPRDQQLRGPDFFDAEQHEQLTFESDAIEMIDDDHWRVRGELTMRGQSRTITLDTRYYGIVDDAWGTTRAGFVAEADINRSDWGMTWNEEQESGSLISDRVRVALFISAKLSDEDAGSEDVEDDDEAQPERDELS